MNEQKWFEAARHYRAVKDTVSGRSDYEATKALLEAREPTPAAGTESLRHYFSGIDNRGTVWYHPDAKPGRPDGWKPTGDDRRDWILVGYRENSNNHHEWWLLREELGAFLPYMERAVPIGDCRDNIGSTAIQMCGDLMGCRWGLADVGRLVEAGVLDLVFDPDTRPLGTWSVIPCVTGLRGRRAIDADGRWCVVPVGGRWEDRKIPNPTEVLMRPDGVPDAPPVPVGSERHQAALACGWTL